MAALIVLAAFAVMLFRHPNAALNRVGDPRGAAATIPQGSSRGVVQASSHAHNPEAEELYLKGRYYWNRERLKI
jgi:hypothetical protein